MKYSELVYRNVGYVFQPNDYYFYMYENNFCTKQCN